MTDIELLSWARGPAFQYAMVIFILGVVLRIMEVLLSAISADELFVGKLVGLGAAALLQVFVWVLAGGLVYLSSGLPPAVDLSTVAFGLAFFLVLGIMTARKERFPTFAS